MKNQLRKMQFNPKSQWRNQRGVTAVEFAIVCPMVLLFVFGMFEISRVITITDSVKTSVVAGAREAGVARTTSDNVEAEVARYLDTFRIRNRDITVSPALIDDSVTQVTINVTVPMTAQNGVLFQKFVSAGSVVEFGAVLER